VFIQVNGYKINYLSRLYFFKVAAHEDDTKNWICKGSLHK